MQNIFKMKPCWLLKLKQILSNNRKELGFVVAYLWYVLNIFAVIFTAISPFNLVLIVAALASFFGARYTYIYAAKKLVAAK